MSSLVTKIAGVNFTDSTIPVLTRDPLIDAGSLMLFDFADPYCWPKQSAPTAGDVVNNLVDGAPFGIVHSAAMGFGGGGLTFSGVAGDYVDLGATYDLHSTSPNFLLLAWIKQTSEGAGNNGVISDGVTYGGMQKVLLGGDSTYHAYEAFIASGAGYAQAPAGGSVPNTDILGAPVQIAVSWVGGSVQAYKNGAVYGAAAGLTGPLNTPTTNLILGQFANPFAGTIYRAYLENLTVSGATALTKVQADYAANRNRFT